MFNANTVTAGAPSSVAAPQDSPEQFGDLSALLSLMVKARAASQASSVSDVQVDQDKLQELRKQIADAIEKAKEAADHSGFFGVLSNVFGSDVAEIAGAVAAAAAVVATGGAATPLILMAVAAAVEEAGKLAAQAGLDPRICLAISIAGAAIGMASGIGSAQAASSVATIARDVKLGAQVTQGAATITGAALGQVSTRYDSDRLHDQADAVSYQAQSDATNMDFDAALSLLQQSLRAEHRETSAASAIIQNNNDASTTLASRI